MSNCISEKILNRVNILTGHYGSGKTNIAINMALELSKLGNKVTIIDLDIVNPYYKTSDFSDFLKKNNISCISPTFSGTNLDLPALTAEVNYNINNQNSKIIIDVGGDDTGANVLGQYSHDISNYKYSLYYIFNMYRYLTSNVENILLMLEEIERASKLHVTNIINNSNLGYETTIQDIENSYFMLESIKQKIYNLDSFTTIADFIPYTNSFSNINQYIIKIYTKLN